MKPCRLFQKADPVQRGFRSSSSSASFRGEGNKALHVLRKEAGAIVVTREGIFAASQFLRHGDIAVTAAHYADKKTRTVIDIGALLDASDSGPPGNVIAMLSKSTLPESTIKAQKK